MLIDVGDSLLALMNVIAISDTLYGMIVEFFLRHQIGDTFKKLSMIYKASKLTYFEKEKTIKFIEKNISNSDKHSDTFRFLAHANNMSEWMWTIFFKCLKLIFFGPY